MLSNDFIGRSLYFIRNNSIDILLVILILIIVLVYKVMLSTEYGGWYGKELKRQEERENRKKHVAKEIIVEGLESISSSKDLKDSEIVDKVEGNFCEIYKGKSHELEEHCNKLSDNNCKTSSCCVLLGGKGISRGENSQTSGTKCVAGNKHGPIYHSDDNQIPINFEYYYYENKCYGENCE
jgi:hypothetical protein